MALGEDLGGALQEGDEDAYPLCDGDAVDEQCHSHDAVDGKRAVGDDGFRPDAYRNTSLTLTYLSTVKHRSPAACREGRVASNSSGVNRRTERSTVT